MSVNSRLRSDLIKLGVFAMVAVLITASVVATLLDLKIGQPQTGYHALFENAAGLQSGDTVRIAGVEVGKVTGVDLTADNRARVTFTVDSSQHLTTSAIASIQFENLLGQRYLQIGAGDRAGSPLHRGATIPMSSTRPGLDLTAVFTGFQPLLAALNPTQVNQLTGSIVAVLQGQSGAIGNLVDQTAVLTNNLAQRQQLIDGILDNLTPVLTSVNAHDAQLQQLVRGLDTLVQGLAGQREQVGSAVSSLGSLTTSTSNLLTNVQPTLDRDLGGLRDVTAELTANQNALDGKLANVLQGLPALLGALDKASSSGNYLDVYICDLTVQTTGPVSVKLSPGVPQSPPLSLPTGPVGNQTQHSGACR